MKDSEHPDFGVRFIDFVDNQIRRAPHYPFMSACDVALAAQMRKVGKTGGGGADVERNPAGGCLVLSKEKIIDVLELSERVSGKPQPHRPHFFQNAAMCSSVANTTDPERTFC
jgi:hypothetical protein